MRRIYQGSALAGTAIGLFVAWHGYWLKIEGLYGPGPGFFPFWIGLIVVLTSLYNLARAWKHASRGLFASWGQLGQVMKVVVPLTIYVAAIPWLGIYLASALLIGGFMRCIEIGRAHV